MAGRQGCSRFFTFIVAVALLFSGSYVLTAEAGGASEPARYKVFSLNHISAELGRKYLTEAKIGTVSQLPSPNTLLVTAPPHQLIKAQGLLKLVDTDQQFVVKAVSPALHSEVLPSNKQIAAMVGDISIGTFSAPPPDNAQTRAIVDVHNDAVFVAAPPGWFARIVSAIERLQKSRVQTLHATVLERPLQPKPAHERKEKGRLQFRENKVPAKPIPADGKTADPKPANLKGAYPEPVNLKQAAPEPAKPEPAAPQPANLKAANAKEVRTNANNNDSGSGNAFNGLLKSLAEAEREAAEKAKEVTEPNEPETVPAPPEPNVPSRPATDVEQPAETAVEVTKEPREPNVPEAQAPKPQPKPAPKRLPLEPEKPGKPEPTGIIRRSYKPEPFEAGNEELDLNLPEKLNIVDLLDLVGKYLDLDYMYDPAEVKGDVTLRVQGPIKVKDLYPLAESALRFKGFVMTRKDNLVTITSKDKVLEIDPVLLGAEKGKVLPGDVIVMRVFNLKHVDTTSAKNLLEGMKLGVDITPLEATKQLIVTDFAYRMGRSEELLLMIDMPGEPKQFRFRQLEYTMAKSLAPKVEELAEQLGEISITVAEREEVAPSAIVQKPGESAAAFRRRQAAAKRAATQRARTKKPSAKKEAGPAEPGVYLDFDERTNRILMIGLKEQLDDIEKLIDSLDVKQQDLRALQLYSINYVGAEEVVQKLEELEIITARRAPVADTRRRPPRTPTRKPGQPQTTPAYREIEEALAGQPQVVIIESSNSLLVNATPEQHLRIATIISYVDTETKEPSINYIVYPLENQDPEDLAAILNQLIKETTTKADKEGKIVSTTTTPKTEEEVTIIPDINTFSLIVYANKKNQQWIKSLIEKLDKRRPQVLLDVTLVQITKDDSFNFDLDLIGAMPDLAFTSGMIPGVDSTVFDKLITATDRNRFIESKSASGSYTGFYGDEQINALLTAVQDKRYGRVMARPKLLVNDNEEGTIQTTTTTYVVRTETGFVGTEEPVTTERTVFEEYSAGITLTIRPHISSGNMLRLEITLNRSDFIGDLEGITKPPDKTDEDVTTVVTVPDRSTIILGGVERTRDTKGGRKVPILGDIPIIGAAFRSVARSGSHDKLYIFVKANILRPGGDTALADLKQVSRTNREAFEKLEREMQEYEEWPGIKPKPLDPLRILEVD